MNLNNYAASSSEHAKEIAQSLTPEEVKFLADELRVHGLEAWNSWREHNQQAISMYVGATPSARKKNKNWQELWVRCFLALAGWRQAYAAGKFLYLVAERGIFLSHAMSYRDTTESAGTLLFEIKDIQIPEWPKEFEQICPSPFQAG